MKSHPEILVFNAEIEHGGLVTISQSVEPVPPVCVKVIF